MDRVVLDERDHIMTIHPVLSPAECADLVAFAEQGGFTAAPITTLGGFEYRPDIRNNTRVMHDDAARADALFGRIGPLLPGRIGAWRIVGLNERLRFYRYEPGQRFCWHGDGTFVRSAEERSLLSLLIYLNDGFSGGATEFSDGPVVQPRSGQALLFSHPVLHQGAAVRSGRKYVLRSDVMYRRGSDA
jgi:hypothetical protein